MTRDQIAAATNKELIARLAVIVDRTVTGYAYRRPEDLDLRRESARIWQEFGSRRRTGKLRMTPKTIRGKVFQAQLNLYR